MKDTTDEDQHPDQAAEDPRTDPATRVADEVDDMQELILAAGDDETPPPSPELLEDTDETEIPAVAEATDPDVDSGIPESVDAESVDAESVDAESVDAESVDAESVDAEPGDTEEGDGDEESATPTAPAYQWFDCTVDDAQVALDAAEAARDAVENGELIVLPTDTVYGIGADAFNADAVQRLLDAKVRGRDMPPPVLIADANLMQGLVADVPDGLLALVALHWPGALTVICTARTSLKMDLGETGGTVALRVPDHDLTRELLRQTGPLAVSSANLSGLPAALTCDDALDQLGGSIAVYLDGGTLGGTTGASSTIVDFTQDDRGEVLRHGALSLEVLRETLPDMLDLVEPEDPAAPDPAAPDPADPAAPADPDPSSTAVPVTAPPVAGHSAEPTQTQQDLDAEATVDWDALSDTERSEDDEVTYGEADEDERHDEHPDDSSPLAQPAGGAEPTTDDLRITHADVDPNQPRLFEAPAGPAPSGARAAQTLQPPTGP